MDQSPYRPRVSRETRLLLSTALLAVMALWVLARIRYPDQPAAPTPVQPLLTQLGTRGSFDDLAEEIDQLRPRVEPFMAGSALRIRSDAAVTLLQKSASHQHGTHNDVIGFDAASGLAVVRVPFLPAPPPVPWSPGDPQEPRFLVATDTSGGALALQPVLVGSLVPAASPLWPGPIWLLSSGAELMPGSFVFTTDALLAGLVVDMEGRRAIVPGSVLVAEATRLLTAADTAPPGEFGVEVQALTPPLARATGAETGVVVSWVDPNGPAAGALNVGDVIEAVDGETVSSPVHWRARAARVPAGGGLTVRVRRQNAVREVALAAVAPRAPPETSQLGLTLRNAPQGLGSLVIEVLAGSAAARAGIRAGDTITLLGDIKAPSPAAVRRAFERASPGDAILVGVVRSGTQTLAALEK